MSRKDFVAQTHRMEEATYVTDGDASTHDAVVFLRVMDETTHPNSYERGGIDDNEFSAPGTSLCLSFGRGTMECSEAA